MRSSPRVCTLVLFITTLLKFPTPFCFVNRLRCHTPFCRCTALPRLREHKAELVSSFLYAAHLREHKAEGAETWIDASRFRRASHLPEPPCRDGRRVVTDGFRFLLLPLCFSSASERTQNGLLCPVGF